MYSNISFSINKNTIHLFGREFLLGELSTQVVNIWRYQTQELYALIDKGMAFIKQYAGSGDDTYLDQAYDGYQQLIAKLQQYPLLALLLDEECIVPKHYNPKYHRCYYIKTCFTYVSQIIDCIRIFHNVIGHFIITYIMPMKELTPGNLSNAATKLNRDYYRMDFPEKDEIDFVPYPDSPIELNFKVVAADSNTDHIQVLEEYTTESLLMMLKIDFYKALEAGHLIRRCEYCGRVFLLTKRLHTKYCDNPAPDNPQYTCAQMGYRLTRRKEEPGDDPKADALRRCLNRISKDCSRQIITEEDKDLLKAKAEELYHAAKIRSGVTYEDFEESLKSKNLYPLCGVTRKSNPVGHPKKETVRS